MANQHLPFHDRIVHSIGDRQLTSAVIWGALVGCFAVIVEYNLSGILFDSQTVRYGVLVGGVVAGFLSSNSWRAAAKAGGYAGALPVIVLAPFAYLFAMAEFLPALELDGGVLIWAVGSILLIYPFAIFVGALMGTFGGLISYVLRTVASNVS